MLCKLAGGGSALALAYVVVELCTMARIALFAHVLAPASMGALIILGTWLRLVEMATDLSIDRFLLRDKAGVRRHVQSAAHGAALLRGAAGSAIMLASTYPLLAIYGLEADAAGFLAAAAIPFVRGFLHTDYRLQNRFLKLRPTIIVELGSAFAGLAAAIGGAFLSPGPESFAAALIAQAVAAVAISHMLAGRRFAIAFDRKVSQRIWHFGWPLTINALFLYAVFQGERMLVGGILGLETLGSYAIVAQLALLPVMIGGRLALNLALPLLARNQGAGGACRGPRDVAILFGSGGVLFWTAFVFLCPPFIALLFGNAYQPHPADLAWIAAAAAIRMQKTGPATVLLAAGSSRAVLAGSSVRLAGLAIGTLALFFTRDLTSFVAIAALSEAASHAVLCRRTAADLRLNMLAIALLPLPVLALACAWSPLNLSMEMMLALCAAASLAALAPLGAIALRLLPRRESSPAAALPANG
jgi:O-antigen/teichoic acid export membrane protein